MIYGAGKLGQQLASTILNHFSGTHQVLGFIDDLKCKCPNHFLGLPILGNLLEISSMAEYSAKEAQLIMGIGYSSMLGRQRAFDSAKDLRYYFESIIHPSSYIEKSATISEGVIILAGVIIDHNVILKPINHIDIGVLIGEDSIIEANNFVAAKTTIAGSVKVGQNNFIGTDTTIVNDIIIGSNNIINAKTLVFRNVANNRKIMSVDKQLDVSL